MLYIYIYIYHIYLIYISKKKKKFKKNHIKVTVIFISMNNETQRVPLLFCHRDFWHTLYLLF